MSEERTTKRGFESDVKVRRIEAGLAGGGWMGSKTVVTCAVNQAICFLSNDSLIQIITDKLNISKHGKFMTFLKNW